MNRRKLLLAKGQESGLDWLDLAPVALASHFRGLL